MSLQEISKRILQQIGGVNPFEGDFLPSRVSLFGMGRPSAPVPLPWNYREPIRILETYYSGSEKETGWRKHNRYLYIGGMPPVFVTRDPGIIKAILAATGDKPGQFDRDPFPATGIARATGEDSLLYANGPIWRRHKTMAAKPFSRSNLFQPHKFHEFEQTFRKTVKERLRVLSEVQAADGDTSTQVELDPEIKVIMLEMLVNNFFGGSVSYEELRDRFVPSLVYMIDYMVTDTITPGLRTIGRMFTGENKILREKRADFEVLTDIALAGRANGLGMWKDFKSEATNEALRSNIRVFLAGAMEATTSFASWAISHLSHNPKWQEKIYQEVKDLDVYDPDSLTQSPNLNRVLEETLRLTPALYFLPRLATADTWVETTDNRKLMIPKGTHISLDVWHANRCDQFWGEAITGYPAEQFAPERWEFMDDKGLSAREMLHFGFGHGPRFCPGRSLGLLEVGLVVGAMVKIFKFSGVGDITPASAGVSTKPADGARVTLELRSL